MPQGPCPAGPWCVQDTARSQLAGCGWGLESCLVAPTPAAPQLCPSEQVGGHLQAAPGSEEGAGRGGAHACKVSVADRSPLACSAPGAGTPGRGCPSFCRHPRRSSSLRRGRSRSRARRSFTWPAPLTCSVSSRPGGGGWGRPQPSPPCPHPPKGTLPAVSGPWGGWLRGRRGGRGRPLPRCLLLNPGADIGHVDFLEKVHSLAERPYVIAGLHFDQVSAPGGRSGGQCGGRRRPVGSEAPGAVGAEGQAGASLGRAVLRATPTLVGAPPRGRWQEAC